MGTSPPTGRSRSPQDCRASASMVRGARRRTSNIGRGACGARGGQRSLHPKPDACRVACAEGRRSDHPGTSAGGSDSKGSRDPHRSPTELARPSAGAWHPIARQPLRLLFHNPNRTPQKADREKRGAEPRAPPRATFSGPARRARKAAIAAFFALSSKQCINERTGWLWSRSGAAACRDYERVVLARLAPLKCRAAESHENSGERSEERLAADPRAATPYSCFNRSA